MSAELVDMSTTSTTTYVSGATSSSTTASKTHTSSMAALTAMLEALASMESNYTMLQNMIATEQSDVSETTLTNQQKQAVKIAREIRHIAHKMSNMKKWGVVEQVGMGIVVAASVAIAFATAGAGSALVALAIGAMMMLPTDINPIDMASTALASQMGGGEWAQLCAKIIVIAAVLILSAGASAATDATAAAQEGGSLSSDAAVQSAKTAAKLATAQTAATLDPLANLIIGIEKACGCKSDQAAMITNIVCSIVMVFASMGLMGAFSSSSTLSETAVASGKSSSKAAPALAAAGTEGTTAANATATSSTATAGVETTTENTTQTIGEKLKALITELKDSAAVKNATGQNGLAGIRKATTVGLTIGTTMSTAGNIGKGTYQIGIGEVQKQQAGSEEFYSILSSILKQLGTMQSGTMSATAQMMQLFGQYNQEASQQTSQWDISV